VPVLQVHLLVTQDADGLPADRGLPRIDLLHRGQQLGDAFPGELGHVHPGQELHRGPHRPQHLPRRPEPRLLRPCCCCLHALKSPPAACGPAALLAAVLSWRPSGVLACPSSDAALPVGSGWCMGTVIEFFFILTALCALVNLFELGDISSNFECFGW
jgi:hypothetical protein